MNHRSKASLLLGVASMIALAAGCSTDDPTEKDAPLQTAPFAEVTQKVDTDAKTIADVVGTDLTDWTANATPCMGRNGEFADDDRWYLGAGGNLKVAAADQLTTLQRIKTTLERQGWEITDNGTFAEGTRGNLDARNPATGHRVTVTTTMDLQYVSVSFSSPCYMPAAGENPLKE